MSKEDRTVAFNAYLQCQREIMEDKMRADIAFNAMIASEEYVGPRKSNGTINDHPASDEEVDALIMLLKKGMGQ